MNLSFFFWWGGLNFSIGIPFLLAVWYSSSHVESWTRPADYATRPRNEFKSGFASVHFNVVVTGVRQVLPSHFMLSSLIRLIIQLERIQICLSVLDQSYPPRFSSRPSGVCYRSVFIPVRRPLFPREREEFTNGRIPLRIAKVFPLFFLHSKSLQFSFWTIANLFLPGSAAALVGKSFLACERERETNGWTLWIREKEFPSWLMKGNDPDRSFIEPSRTTQRKFLSFVFFLNEVDR